MTNTLLCSVVLPAFNAQKYLLKAIESILNQTYQNIELIIINDGSTDETKKIIDTFKDNTKVKIINNKKNMGLIYSLNYALNQTNGHFIARMDADDISLPTRIEQQINYLTKHSDIDLCGCSIKTFGATDKILYAPKSWQHSAVKTFFSTPVFHPTILFKKNLLKEGFTYNPDFKSAEDYDLWERLIITNKIKFANLQTPLYLYREHEDSVSFTQNTLQKKHTDNIRLRQYKRLLPSATDKDLFLKFMHLHNNLKYNCQLLNNFADLVQDLCIANHQKLIYPEPLFNNTLQYKIYLHHLNAIKIIKLKALINYLKQNDNMIIKLKRFIKLTFYLLKPDK